MTAEIAVMNKAAVALAADSKVTVTSGGTTKTYDTVSKLFTLSKVAPVGIMIYGNAEFMGYPWETIIKMYRRQKGRDTERTVEAWSVDFFAYVERFGKITAAHREGNVRNICQSILHEALEMFGRSGECDGLPPGSDEFQTGFRGLLKKRVGIVAAHDPWVKDKRAAALIAELGKIVAEVVEQFLGDHTDETKQLALALVAGALIFKFSSPQVSGVVIAGFGDDEYFPSLLEHRIEGYVGKRIKRYVLEPVLDISREDIGYIRAFAQREMVERFMNGIDPSYAAYLSYGIPELVVDNCFSTLEAYGMKRNQTEKIKNEVRDAVKKAVAEFQEESKNYRRNHFTYPVMRMVSVLPKDELAHLAESLVALTSLKRRVSSDTETVGGPIDVALISKGDGFIWIKRKHYFNAELNPQFVRTYMDGIHNGGSDDAERGTATRSRRPAATTPSRGSKKTGKAGTRS